MMRLISRWFLSNRISDGGVRFYNSARGLQTQSAVSEGTKVERARLLECDWRSTHENLEDATNTRDLMVEGEQSALLLDS